MVVVAPNCTRMIPAMPHGQSPVGPPGQPAVSIAMDPPKWLAFRAGARHSNRRLTGQVPGNALLGGRPWRTFERFDGR